MILLGGWLGVVLGIVLGIVTTAGLGFAEDIRDIKGPVDFPSNFFWLFFLLGCVGLVGLFWGVRWFLRKSRQTQKTSEPPLPAHVVAYRRLEQLKSQNWPQQGMVKEFFVELCDIVRRYIEARFQIKAIEMTTEEFLRFLQDSDWLNFSHKQLLKEFMNCCDLVKFARYGPTPSEIDHSFLAAQRFVDETKPLEQIVKIQQGR